MAASLAAHNYLSPPIQSSHYVVAFALTCGTTL